jgi:NitT/TauT family transport system ATP-binding protein
MVAGPGTGSTRVALNGVSVVYSIAEAELTALDGIDLSVAAGEFVSVIGPSGCGKSTLLRVAGGLLAPTKGVALIDGREPTLAQHDKQIGYVFQDPTLLPWRTVYQNVELPLTLNRRGRGQEPSDLLELVGLSAFRSYYPHQLSGGMQQRVALARALVTSPSLLLMDEPFGALDEITRSAMRYELLRIWSSGQSERTVVFVTHSITEAVSLSDRVIVLTPRPGRIAADIAINLPRPRTEDLELDQPFLEYCSQLRASLTERSAA